MSDTTPVTPYTPNPRRKSRGEEHMDALETAMDTRESHADMFESHNEPRSERRGSRSIVRDDARHVYNESTEMHENRLPETSCPFARIRTNSVRDTRRHSRVPRQNAADSQVSDDLNEAVNSCIIGSLPVVNGSYIP
ncbi:unnamed protein product [Anisakis simplex]|uniref:Uncharacterized protein n=1 Tax=Anisakis simplex TaxID=6269 RepID=A0A0M3KIL5_ANISI|nr:unnamed protein product [Anisakis simplex]